MRKRILTPEQKERQLQYVRNHYHANKEYYYERNKRNKNKTKEWFDSLLKGKICSFCSEKEQCTFDYHHIDPSKKDFNLGNLRSSTYGKDTVLKEIDKCILVCSNCHRKIHAGIIVL